jgi:predicted negative regulator of RcsB-dependent stress response
MRTLPEAHLRPWAVTALLILAVTTVPCSAADPLVETRLPILPVMQNGNAAAPTATTEAAPPPLTSPKAPVAVPAAAPVEAPAPTVERRLWTNRTTVEIPVTEDLVPAKDFRGDAPKAVVLFVSGNRGRTWIRAMKCALPAKTLEFRAAGDGEFWCLWRGEPIAERGPGPAATDAPDRIVIVDTAEPVFVQLAAGAPADDGTVRVTWNATDGLPPAKVKAVAIHEPDGTVALPKDGQSDNQGWAQFQLTAPGAWLIGVQIQDLAGNAVTGRCRVTIPPPPAMAEKLADAPALVPAAPAAGTKDATTATPPAPTVPPGAAIESPAEVQPRKHVTVLNARTIQIGYRWDAEHPPSHIGLWVTRDGGRTWNLDQVATELDGKFIFRAVEDGTYGFRTHREVGDRVWGSPQVGDAPEREVILDATPAVVEWTSPLGAPTGDGDARKPAKVAGTAALRWTTVEAHPGETPVTLDYRLFGQDAWRPLAGPIADRGAYDWALTDIVAPSAEVRLTYRDLAGHVTVTSIFLEIVRDGAKMPEPPKVVGEEARNQARRAYALATVARLQEDWAGAEKHLLQSTESDPTNARAWVDLGGVYVHGGRWQSASDAYRRALALAPDSENASLGLAQSLTSQRDLKGAAETLDKLVQKSPENADAWRLYGDVLYASGDLEKARKCWMTALGLGGGPEANLAALRQRLQLKQ